MTATVHALSVGRVLDVLHAHACGCAELHDEDWVSLATSLLRSSSPAEFLRRVHSMACPEGCPAPVEHAERIGRCF